MRVSVACRGNEGRNAAKAYSANGICRQARTDCSFLSDVCPAGQQLGSRGPLGRIHLGRKAVAALCDGTYPDRRILDDLAGSTNLWEQRIAIVSTSTLIRAGQYEDTLRIADVLLGHPHDLIHKAVGWMLREVGKKDIALLRRYLSDRYSRMPRTALRYAIERMDSSERREWLSR